MATCTAEAEDNTRAVSESDDLSLVLRDRVVDRVLVLEIVQARNGEGRGGRSSGVHCVIQRASLQGLIQVGNESISAFRRYLLVVISAEEGASVDGVEFIEQIVNSDQLVW